METAIFCRGNMGNDVTGFGAAEGALLIQKRP